MRVVILCMGSRGDVQPNVALGKGLRRAGHRVRIATHPIFKELVAANGLEFAPLNSNPQEILQGVQGQALLSARRNPFRFMRNFKAVARPLVAQVLSDCWDACEGAEAIAFSILGFAGYHIAEKLRIPCFASALQPLTRTRAFPALSTRSPGLETYNRLTHLLAEQVTWQPFRQLANQWRKEFLNLPPLRLSGPYSRLLRQQLPHLYGFSPAVVPKPLDWPEWIHVTGYWFLDHPADWRPSPDLVDFLEAGPPPVYVGFGSMAEGHPEAATDLVLRALALSDQRGIVLTGWGGLGGRELPPTVFQVDSIPHDWLFPQVAAVVHHGGAGTTAAALRAGVPSVVTPILTSPFIGDQSYWGGRVHKLGVGPKSIPVKQLTADKLASAIEVAITDEGIRARACAIGETIRAEDGVTRAVEAFDLEVRSRNWERVWSTW